MVCTKFQYGEGFIFYHGTAGPGPVDYAPTDPFYEFKLVGESFTAFNGFILRFAFSIFFLFLLDSVTGKLRAFPTSPCPTVRHAHAFDGM